MTYLCKDDNITIGEHIRNFKGICDNLAAIGSPVFEEVKVFSLLTSLGPKYESFTTTVLKPPHPTYTELVSLLQGYEQRQKWFTTNTTAHQLAIYGQKQRPQQYTSSNRGSQNQFNSNGRGFQAHNQNSNNAGNTNFSRQTTHNNNKQDPMTRRPPLPGQR